jgi:hypothetical protein
VHWPTGLRATQDSTGAVEEELPADVSAALEAEQGLSCASGDSCLQGAHAAVCSTPPGKGALRGAGPARSGSAARLLCVTTLSKCSSALEHMRVAELLMCRVLPQVRVLGPGL